MNKSPIETLQRYVQAPLKRLFYARIAISIFMLGWLGYITYKLSRADKEDPDGNGTKYFYLHRVWFGETSIIATLFQMWWTTLLLFMLSPILRFVYIYVQAVNM